MDSFRTFKSYDPSPDTKAGLDYLHSTALPVKLAFTTWCCTAAVLADFAAAVKYWIAW
jgi:hypothetical protein